MRKTIVIIALGMSFLLLASMSVTAAYHTAKVSVSSITADMDDDIAIAYTPAGDSTYVNISLPCPLSELSTTSTMLDLDANTAEGNFSYNFTVNGVSASYWNQTTPGSIHWTLGNWTEQGVSNTSTYLNITVANWGANDSNASNVNIVASGAAITTTLSSVAQTITSRPEVGWDEGDETFGATDNITVTNSKDVDLTDMNVSISYPGYWGAPAVSKDTTVGDNYTISSLASSATNYQELKYTKRGPHVTFKNLDHDATDDTYELRIHIASYETLNSTVDWTIDIDDHLDYFPHFNMDDYTLRLNGKTISTDEDEDDNQISFDRETFVYGRNTVKIVWSAEEEAGAVAVVTENFWTAIYFMMPNWIWIGITAIIAVFIVYGYYNKKK